MYCDTGEVGEEAWVLAKRATSELVLLVQWWSSSGIQASLGSWGHGKTNESGSLDQELGSLRMEGEPLSKKKLR